MADRDINIDTLHHIQGLSNLSNSIKRRKEKKDEKRKDRKVVGHLSDIDEKLEEELEIEEKEVLADKNMGHIDFRA